MRSPCLFPLQHPPGQTSLVQRVSRDLILHCSEKICSLEGLAEVISQYLYSDHFVMFTSLSKLPNDLCNQGLCLRYTEGQGSSSPPRPSLLAQACSAFMPWGGDDRSGQPCYPVLCKPEKTLSAEMPVTSDNKDLSTQLKKLISSNCSQSVISLMSDITPSLTVSRIC